MKRFVCGLLLVSACREPAPAAAQWTAYVIPADRIPVTVGSFSTLHRCRSAILDTGLKPPIEMVCGRKCQLKDDDTIKSCAQTVSIIGEASDAPDVLGTSRATGRDMSALLFV